MTQTNLDFDGTQDSGEHLKEKIGLQGAMSSFEGTLLVPLIKNALDTAGIDPRKYEIADEHAIYRGLPATERRFNEDESVKVSPIIEAIFDGLEDGSIVTQPTGFDKVDIVSDKDNKTSNARLLTKLYSFNLEEIIDVKSGDVMAYAAPLSSDGGRSGYAILSTNDVLVR